MYGADIDKGQWDERVSHFPENERDHINALLPAVSQNTARIEECQIADSRVEGPIPRWPQSQMKYFQKAQTSQTSLSYNPHPYIPQQSQTDIKITKSAHNISCVPCSEKKSLVIYCLIHLRSWQM